MPRPSFRFSRGPSLLGAGPAATMGDAPMPSLWWLPMGGMFGLGYLGLVATCGGCSLVFGPPVHQVFAAPGSCWIVFSGSIGLSGPGWSCVSQGCGC